MKRYKDLNKEFFATQGNAPSTSPHDTIGDVPNQISNIENSEVAFDVVDSNGKPAYPQPNSSQIKIQAELEGSPENFGVTQEEFTGIREIAEQTGKDPKMVMEVFKQSNLSIDGFKEALNPSNTSPSAKNVQESLGTFKNTAEADNKNESNNKKDEPDAATIALIAEEEIIPSLADKNAQGPNGNNVEPGSETAASPVTPESTANETKAVTQAQSSALPSKAHGLNKSLLNTGITNNDMPKPSSPPVFSNEPS